MGVYAATKFAITGYIQAMRQELRAEGFHLALVYPGPVDTDLIADHFGGENYPRPPLVPIVSAERVAKQVLRCVRRRQHECVVPWHAAGALRQEEVT
jgi:short-subunit dehydrogenase